MDLQMSQFQPIKQLYMYRTYLLQVLQPLDLCSRSKIAALKTLSILGLELCTCLLLAKLLKKVLSFLNVEIETVVLWSDFKISFAWIKKIAAFIENFCKQATVSSI